MEYWEFLLQKEGDRSWQPIKTPNVEIEEGRYRVVAHSNRPNTDVEIRVTHQSAREKPPKRRSQKRSRRTNREGLMVVIPYTYLKAGFWELRCSGDIMSDLLGQTWRHSIQLQVLPKAQPPVPAATTLSEVTEPNSSLEVNEAELSKSHNQQKAAEPESSPEVKEAELSKSLNQPQTDAEPESPPEVNVAESTKSLNQQQKAAEPEEVHEAETVREIEGLLTKLTPTEAPAEFHPVLTVAEIPIENETPLAIASDTEIAPPLQAAESGVTPSQPQTPPPLQVGSHINPLMEQSLQNLEQMLQQVLEPILQEFEDSEQGFEEPPLSEPDFSSPFLDATEIDSNLQGLLLNLEQETLVAHRGQSLTLSGQVDFLDITQHNEAETASDVPSVLQGTLRICLRDPQNSQLILDLRHPLPEQGLPLSFSYTFDLPANCQTRLILGEVILYDATPTALASQPFSITVDLEELLGTLLGRTSNDGMSLVTTPSPAEEEIETAELPEALLIPEAEPVRAKLAFLDLKETPLTPIPIQPAVSKPLPPQIYQPTSGEKPVKSLQLPKLPKPEEAVVPIDASYSIAPNDAIDFWDNDEDDASVDLLETSSVDTASAETRSQPKELEPDTTNLVSLSKEPTPSGIKPQWLSAQVEEQPSQETENGVKWLPKLLPDASPGMDELSEEDDPSYSLQPTALFTPSPVAASFSPWVPGLQTAHQDATELDPTEPIEVENAFQSLNLQARFWSRLNSMAIDTELGEWLKDDLVAFEHPEQAEDAAEFVEPTPDEAAIDPIDWDTEPDQQEHTESSTDEEEWETVPSQFAEIAVEPLDWDTESSGQGETTHTDWEAVPSQSDEIAAEPQDADAEPIAQMETALEPIDWDVELNEPNETPLEPIDWDTEASDLTETAFEEETITPETPTFLEVEPLEPEVPINPDASLDWTTQEIVVEDDLPSPKRPAVTSGLGNATAESPLLSAESIALRADQLIPTPELIISPSDLIAGELATVRIKLPLVSDPFYVKLWIQDRQSRLVLDGPRSLADFSPSRSTLETMIQLTVPFGSMEIRFEAITIDAATQSESHKVIVDRVVLPPDVLNFSLDEFET